MAVAFYYSSGSPFAWRVWLALEHKGIDYELKSISFSEGDLSKPEFHAINPRHKVPAIVDDGFSLYESLAIMEYLEEKYATGERLFPEDVKARALARRMMHETDQYVFKAFRPVADQLFFTPKEKWDSAKIERDLKALATELAMWEQASIGQFLVGDRMTAADFVLYPMLALALRLEKKKADAGIRQMIGPKLARWMQNMTDQPIVRTTWPPHWK